MTFLNAAILTGLGLTAIPVILHFLLKQKPKKLIFPALRLIEERRKQSVKRLRLKHFWLMLLRMLALGLIVFALARPSLPPANYSLSRFEIGTLFAVVFIGVAIFLWLVRRTKQRSQTKFLVEEQQSHWRNWTTVGTLLAILLLVGIPYQQRVAAEITDPGPARELDLPVAGIMLFDNSLSMSYLLEGTSALEGAQKIAGTHLQSLPAGSRIAIADNASDNPILFQTTILSAKTRLENLKPKQVSLPLEDRIRDALRAQEDDRTRTLSDQAQVADDSRKDRYIRRIYVFTDLAKSAWREGGGKILKAELERLPNLNLYLIDVGQEQPLNLAVTDITLSRERIPLGGDLIVSSTVQAAGEDQKGLPLELLFTDPSGKTFKQGQTNLDVDAELPVQIEFPVVTDLTNRLVQGEVRLGGGDSLSFDNVRYFSAEVSPPPKVIVVAPNKNMANEWMTALAPHETLNDSKNKFRPEFVPSGRLPQLNLADYAAVTLLNVPALTDDNWYQLGKYVENGGGLTVILGSFDIKATSYNRAQALNFLPAQLDAWSPIADGRFDITERSSPLFWKFRQLENYGSFSMMENDVVVSRFWKTEPAEGANVLATYNDATHSPAIIERSHGRGRTIMVTTATDLPLNYRQRWNNLPSPLISPWLFIAFSEQITEYVSRFTDRNHNYMAGDTPTIALEAKSEAQEFLLKEPNHKQSKHVLPANETQLSIRNVTEFGHYELTERGSQTAIAGFSMNSVPKESDLTRLSTIDLNEKLGENRYQLARNIDELKDDINAADLGQEVYPVILMLVIVMFCGEHLVANRFYRVEPN